VNPKERINLEETVDLESAQNHSTHHVPNFLPTNVTSEQVDIITEDPATYLVAHHVVFNSPTTLESVLEYFSFEPSLAPVVHKVISSMEERGLLTVNAGIIRAEKQINIPSNPDQLIRYIPTLFELGVKQVIKDAKVGKIRERKEGLQITGIPNTPELAIQAQAIFEEFRAKLIALANNNETTRSEDTRIIGIYNCLIDPKEFV
jgi:hypothetical protein